MANVNVNLDVDLDEDVIQALEDIYMGKFLDDIKLAKVMDCLEELEDTISIEDEESNCQNAIAYKYKGKFMKIVYIDDIEDGNKWLYSSEIDDWDIIERIKEEQKEIDRLTEEIEVRQKRVDFYKGK